MGELIHLDKDGKIYSSLGTLYASDVLTDVSNFDGALSAADVDVQTALDTLDAAAVPRAISVWIPAVYIDGGGAMATIGAGYSGIQLAAAEFVDMPFSVPANFGSLVSFNFFIWADSTETISYDVSAALAADDETYTTHTTSNNNQTKATTQYDIYALNAADVIPAIAGGDSGSLRVNSDQSYMYVLGALLVYIPT